MEPRSEIRRIGLAQVSNSGGHALLAGLIAPERVLNDGERVFDFGPNVGFGLFDSLDHPRQRAVAESLAFAGLHRDVSLRALSLSALGQSAVASIAKRIGPLSVE